MDFKRIPIMIDAASGKQIDESGAVITSESDFMRLMYSEICVICATFYDVTEDSNGYRTLVPHAVPPSATLKIAGDGDFNEKTPLMFYSGQTAGEDNRIDIVGDWLGGLTADRMKGQVSFRINTRTAKFIEYLTTSTYSKSTCYCGIEMIPAGSLESSALASFRFTAINRVTSEVNQPEPDDPTYPTTAQIIALLKLAREYRFSADGSDWHSGQVAADRFKQERYPGGEWGESERLPGYHPQGVYSSAVSYYSGDTVSYGGSTYASNIDNNLNHRPDESVSWTIIAERGSTGYYFTPSVSETGDLSWTNNGTLSNPATVSILGPQGRAATISAGTVTMADYGTAPQVANSGTAGDAVFNFTIPSAPLMLIQYSADGATWENSPSASTVYARYSNDNGGSWGNSFRTRGLNGIGYVPRGAYSATATYAIDELVSYNGNLYASIQAGNTGNLPADTAYWLRVVSGSGQAAITIFTNIAERDAYTPSATGELAFVRDATGDSTVAAGSAEYLWDGINSAWIKVFESESLDLVLSFSKLSGAVADNAALSAAFAAKANLSGATFTGAIAASNLSGTNTGDETASTITSKLGFTPASNAITINGHALNDNVAISASDLSTGTLPAARLPALTGDVAAEAGTGQTAVIAIRGAAVDATAPADGQVLKYNSATGKYVPAAAGTIVDLTKLPPLATDVTADNHGLPLVVYGPSPVLTNRLAHWGIVSGAAVAGGTLVDTVAGSYSGGLQGNAYVSAANGIVLDGDGDFSQVGVSNMISKLSQFSIAIRFKLSEINKSQCIYCEATGDGGIFQLFVSAENKLAFNYWTGSSVVLYTTTTLNANTLYTAIAQKNSSGDALYLNNVLEASNSVTNTVSLTANRAYIGCGAGGSSSRESYFHGNILDLRLFTVPLTEKQRSDYNNGETGAAYTTPSAGTTINLTDTIPVRGSSGMTMVPVSKLPISDAAQTALNGKANAATTANVTLTFGVSGKPSPAITAIVGGGSLATATLKTGSTVTGLAAGDVMVIAGTTNYNGEVTIASVTSTEITFASTQTATENNLTEAIIRYKQAVTATQINDAIYESNHSIGSSYALDIGFNPGHYDLGSVPITITGFTGHQINFHGVTSETVYPYSVKLTGEATSSLKDIVKIIYNQVSVILVQCLCIENTNNTNNYNSCLNVDNNFGEVRIEHIHTNFPGSAGSVENIGICLAVTNARVYWCTHQGSRYCVQAGRMVWFDCYTASTWNAISRIPVYGVYGIGAVIIGPSGNFPPGSTAAFLNSVKIINI